MTTEPKPMPDLLPCPFCGDKVFLEGSEFHGHSIECQCRNLMTSGKDEVVKAWNTRAEPVNRQDTVAIPRDLLDKIANGLEDIAHLGSPYGKEKRGNSNGNVMAGDLADLLKPSAEQQLEKEKG